MRHNNRVVCDLNKAQWMQFGYHNQHSQTTPTLPSGPSVFGQVFQPDSLHLSGAMTMIDYAEKMKLLDVWTPYVVIQFSANHSLTYTGDKAKSLWKEWGKRIFEKNKKKS